MIDIVFVGLVVVATIITAVVLGKVVTGTFYNDKLDINSSNGESSADHVGEEINNTQITIQDVNRNPDDEERVFSSRIKITEANSDEFSSHPAVNSLYDYSAIILPIAWGAVAGTLIWRRRLPAQ
ncbi:MAG: hypothetical protein ACREAY_07285 [Nitrososphaera sp.]|uniref:hypothetical protein n=1 Tax=Nitrososphaera sp. TaxID=1971748 RepID=UPI003D6F80D3